VQHADEAGTMVVEVDLELKGLEVWPLQAIQVFKIFIMARRGAEQEDVGDFAGVVLFTVWRHVPQRRKVRIAPPEDRSAFVRP
jgi:hypothetical protein